MCSEDSETLDQVFLFRDIYINFCITGSFDLLTLSCCNLECFFFCSYLIKQLLPKFSCTQVTNAKNLSRTSQPNSTRTFAQSAVWGKRHWQLKKNQHHAKQETSKWRQLSRKWTVLNPGRSETKEMKFVPLYSLIFSFYSATSLSIYIYSNKVSTLVLGKQS